MAVQIADGPDGLDHDLKFTRCCIQPIPPKDQKLAGTAGRNPLWGLYSKTVRMSNSKHRCRFLN